MLISVAEIRYRHDFVRLCHKFYFCPFQMKIPHIDEEKELYALSRALSRFFVWGGVDPRKIFGATQRREKFFQGLWRGPGACSHGKSSLKH